MAFEKKMSDHFKNSYEGASIHILRNGIPFMMSDVLGELVNETPTTDAPYPQIYYKYTKSLKTSGSEGSNVVLSITNCG